MIDILICFVKTIIGYFILLYISVNLLGMIVRGFYDKTDNSEIDPILHKEVKKLNRAANFTTILFILLAIGYYYVLSHFGGIGIVLTAAMLMLGRLQDLLWEIRNGRKVTAKDRPKGILSILSTTLDWGAFVVLWFALYYHF